jgi:hypothetical protein
MNIKSNFFEDTPTVYKISEINEELNFSEF